MIKAYKFIRRDGTRIHCFDLVALINGVIDELETMDLAAGETHSIIIGAYETTEESFNEVPSLNAD